MHGNVVQLNVVLSSKNTPPRTLTAGATTPDEFAFSQLVIKGASSSIDPTQDDVLKATRDALTQVLDSQRQIFETWLRD